MTKRAIAVLLCILTACTVSSTFNPPTGCIKGHDEIAYDQTGSSRKPNSIFVCDEYRFTSEEKP